MKKFSILVLAFVALVTLNSCSNDDNIVVAQPYSGSLDIENTFEDLYILEGMATDSVVETFNWSEVNFDAPSPITYELQAATNASFDSLETLSSRSVTSAEVTTEDLKLVTDSDNLEYPNPEDPQIVSVYFRIRAFLGNGEGNAMEKFSNPVNLSVKLPEMEEEKLNLYLVGDGTAAGWNPNNNNTPLFRDPENDEVFSYSGYFQPGAVKFVEGTGWAPQYGVDGSNGLVYRATEADPDPSAITIEEAGFYTIEVNLASLTYSLTEIDASSAETYDAIGLVGAGTSVGWPSDSNPSPDIQFNQSEFNPHIWYAENIVLTDGPIKFRANLAWDVNWGGNQFPSGVAVINGTDIAASAGTYDIWFNTLDGSYILIPQEIEE